MSSNGLMVRGDRLPAFRTIDEWGAGLKWLVGFHRQWKWMLGEYLVRGEEIYNEKIWQFIDPADLGLKSRQDVSNAMYVYRACRDQYTPAIEEWTFWQSMAPLTREQRDHCITRALGTGISRDEIRALRVDSKVNGAGSGSDAGAGFVEPTSGLPNARGLALQAFVDVLAASGRLAVRFGKGEAVNGLLRDALDDLTAKAMILRELL